MYDFNKIDEDNDGILSKFEWLKYQIIEGKYPDGTDADATSEDYSAATWTDCAIETETACTNKYWPEAVPTVDPLNCAWQWDTTTRRIPEGNSITDTTGNGC